MKTKHIKQLKNKFTISERGIVARLPHKVKNPACPKGYFVCKPKIMSICNGLNGYKVLRLKDKNYNIHRLLAETFIPNPNNLKYVDHIDGDKNNNNLSNLRWADGTLNSFNKKNTKGYSFDKRTQRWHTYINKKHIRYNLGYFKTKEEAIKIRKEAEKDFYKS